MSRPHRVLAIHDVERELEDGRVLRWAYATRTHCLQKYAPADIDVRRASHASVTGEMLRWADLVFLLDYALVSSYRNRLRQLDNRPVFVVSFNKDHRSRHSEWEWCLDCADWVVVNNRSRWVADGVRERTCCIANGLDLEQWRSIRPIKERSHKVLWTGGTGPAKRKGYQDLIHPLIPELQRMGFEWDFRPVTDIEPGQVMTADQMVEWYNSGSYVVCASATEGTPGYLLEGMACGCCAVTTDVGNVPELPSSTAVIVQRGIHSILNGLELARSVRTTLSEVTAQSMRSWGYGPPGRRADYFYQLFRRLIEDGPRDVRPFNYQEVGPGDI